MTQITVDMVVEAFVKTRDEIAKKKKEFEAWKAEQTKTQDARENWLRKFLEDSGQTKAGTAHGTVHFKRKEFLKVADWDIFLKYIRDTDQYHLLKKDVAKTGALELMGDLETVEISGKKVERRPNNPPPGLDYGSIREVGIRKS